MTVGILSRRHFLFTSASALTIQAIVPAKAWIHGSATNNNRVTINVPSGGYMNLAKSADFNTPARLTAVDVNGYPTTTPVDTSANLAIVANYYGKYTWKWTGRGSMQISGPPTIIYSGSVVGNTDGNTGVYDQTAPTIVFKFGALVTAVSGGSGSLVTITTTSVRFGTGFDTGSQIKFATGVSSNLSSGPNSDGSWTITNVSGTQFTLNGSTGVVSPTVTGTGGAGVQSEAVMQVANVTLYYANTGTFSGFTNLVICKDTDATDIANGKIYDQTLVDQLTYLMNSASRGSPGWLRFMDVSGVQGSFECDYAQRVTASTQLWGGLNFPAAYAAGAITRGSSDAYTCANPSGSPASGAPIDCEIIQGTPSATNTGGTPTLAITGRTGTWPIIDGRNPLTFRFSAAPASAGLTLQFTFSATWLNGGTPYVKSYTTVSGDTASVAALNGSLMTAFSADATLAAGKIIFTNSAQVVAFPRTPLAGALTVTYTSGPAICTIIALDASTITTAPSTFIFNKLLGGFIYQPNGLFQGAPFESIVDLCNRVGANCWYNWPIYTKGQYITDSTAYFASNLTSGLKFGAETGNEMWNFVAQLWTRGQAYGFALDMPNGGNAATFSWQGLRTIQYAALSRAAWLSGGRAASDHYVLTMGQTGDTTVGGTFDVGCLRGTYLATSNTVYATYGGLACVSSPDYSAANSQPVDSSDAIGVAPYWASPWWAYAANVPGAGGVSGPLSENIPPLQAAKDYGNGLTTTAYASLVNQFNGTTTRASGTSNGIALVPGYSTDFVNEEAQAAQYDSRRVTAGKAKLAIMHYEGGPNWAMGADFNNGVNSVNSTDIAALANQMTALSWNVSPYTHTGANDTTEMATMVITMIMAWKYDTTYKDLIKTYYYQALRSTSGSNREARPAQFGYSASQWGFFPGSYVSGNQYQNYDAVHEFNA